MIEIDGCIVLLPESNEIKNHVTGKSLRIEPLEAKILLYLVNNGGRVCANEEIVNEIWNENIDVGREALRRNIYKLRNSLKTLGGNNLIETIPKRGYRIKVSKERKWLAPKSYITYATITIFLLLVFLITDWLYPALFHFHFHPH